MEFSVNGLILDWGSVTHTSFAYNLHASEPLTSKTNGIKRLVTPTWKSLAVSKVLDLPVQDASPPAESLKKLHFLFINDILHCVWVFLQLRKSISL